MITDGQQTTTEAYTPLDIASKGIKDRGVEVFALGIGSGVDTDQLRQIASSNDNVFTSPGFDELVSVVKPIVEKSCPSKSPLYNYSASSSDIPLTLVECCAKVTLFNGFHNFVYALCRIYIL